MCGIVGIFPEPALAGFMPLKPLKLKFALPTPAKAATRPILSRVCQRRGEKSSRRVWTQAGEMASMAESGCMGLSGAYTRARVPSDKQIPRCASE
jgi:hypothetical protein